jgi:PKD repeat protein
MKKLSFLLMTAAVLSLSSCSEDPSADFTSDATTVNAGEVVQFTDNSTAGYNHVWDFGDGEWSTAINPTHIYYDEGVYDVTLQVTDKKGEEVSISASQSITVLDTVRAISEGEQAEQDEVIAMMVGDWELSDYEAEYPGFTDRPELGDSRGEFMSDGTIVQMDAQGNVSTGYYDVINKDYVYLSFVWGPSGVYYIDNITDSRMILVNEYLDSSLPPQRTTHTLEFRK